MRLTRWEVRGWSHGSVDTVDPFSPCDRLASHVDAPKIIPDELNPIGLRTIDERHAIGSQLRSHDGGVLTARVTWSGRIGVG